MKKWLFLLIIGCLSFSCKFESAKGDVAVYETCQADVSIHKVYTVPELAGIMASDGDSIREMLLASMSNYGVICAKDTAAVKEYIGTLDFSTPTRCAFRPIENDVVSMVVYEAEPLMIETVEVTSEPFERLESFQLLFKFTDAEKWERITAKNIGRQLAVAVNGEVKTAPTVNEPITEGRCSVAGLSADEINKLMKK